MQQCLYSLLGAELTVTARGPLQLVSHAAGRHSPTTSTNILGMSVILMRGYTDVQGTLTVIPNGDPADLQALFLGDGIQVATDNEGMGGDNSSNWLNVNGETTPPCDWPTEMATSKAQVIVMNWGINDSFQLTPTQFQSSMETLIEETEAAGKVVIIETPNPVDPSINPEVAANLPALVAIDKVLRRKVQPHAH